MYYIGIDPGKSGAFAIIDEKERIIQVELFTSLSVLSPSCLSCNSFTALEKVHAMPGQGVVSMFTFAENYGAWQGFMQALRMPHILVTPQKWQKTILDFQITKEVKPPGETPASGRARLMHNRQALKFGIVEFIKRRLPQSRDLILLKKDYDKADALCLALYAKKVHLNEL